MTYEIQNRSDFLLGSFLVIRIPEDELDQNALYTIQEDCPDFLLPFHYKNVNGEIELTYKIGTQSKLQYFSGDLTKKEYVKLWQSMFNPLLDCGDWFMNPCSFVLNADYLYYDKKKNAVSYVYVPSVCGCSNYEAFHEMAVEVSKMMTVSDAVLENKVLRAIIQDFYPTEFLKMLKDHIADHDAHSELAQSRLVEPHEPQMHKEPAANHLCPGKNRASATEVDLGEDMIISIQPDIKPETNGREKESWREKIFNGRGKRKKSSALSMPENDTSLNESMLESTYGDGSDAIEQAEIIDITQSATVMLVGTGLRYVGHADLPQSISVTIIEGEIFTIGRFDANIGKQQSSFEFDKRTKAVSRRHAVIERDVEGYKIVDLSSSAGTFVNDRKIPPNTPQELELGCRVSFGNSGADYVWQVS